MAKLDDLIAQVSDPSLRSELAQAAHDVRQRRTFGLVFEEHIPETTLLRNFPARVGATVCRREDTTASTPLVVTNIRGKSATVALPSGDAERVPINELSALKRFGDPIYPTLTPVDKIERSADRPYHVAIDGENFHALQLLGFMYEGQVDCIYIDPPYNSGARDWKYNNNFVDDNDRWRHSKWLSMMEKRLGLAKMLLKDDGVLIVTIDENEVHHLGMLLEQVFPSYLRYMVNIVINPKGTNKANFGRVEEHAFYVVPDLDHDVIAQQSPPKDQGEAHLTAVSEDRAGDDEGVWVRELTAGRLELPPGLRERLGLDDMATIEMVHNDDGLVTLRPTSDETAPDEEADADESSTIDNTSVLFLRRRGAESSFRHQRSNQFYAIKVDELTRKVVGVGPFMEENDSYQLAHKEGEILWVYPVDEDGNERVWRYVRETMQRYIDAGEIRVGTHWDNKPQTYTLNHYKPRQGERVQRLRTTWWRASHDAGTHGTTLISRLLGTQSPFPFPKSLYAVCDCLEAVVKDRPEALILDFFAGSGTTLHATALLNRADGGHRRCVLVTNNEVDEKTTQKLHKEGLYAGDKEYDRHGIFEAATKPRIATALTGVRPDGTQVPAGKAYRYLDGTSWADGFEENCAFLRIDYLEPDEVELGHQFAAILPTLWLASGGVGPLPTAKSRNGYLLPPESSFGVLLRESALRTFLGELERRSDVTHIWIATDSVRAFADMRATISDDYTVAMLYRDYLRNFAINMVHKA